MYKRIDILILTAFLSVLIGTNAAAQCGFDAPNKAKGIKSSLVRAYESCPGPTYPNANTSTAGGVPGCTPPVPISGFKLGPKGFCSIRLAVKLKDPCSSISAFPCLDPKVIVKCKDVRDALDTPDNSSGWRLNLVGRFTTNTEGVVGDITTLDYPFSVAFPQAKNGKLKLSVEISDFLCQGICEPFGPISFSQALPICTNFELLDSELLDPNGDLFATVGLSAR